MAIDPGESRKERQAISINLPKRVKTVQKTNSEKVKASPTGFEGAQTNETLNKKRFETVEETSGNYHFDSLDKIPRKRVKPPSKTPKK